MAEFSENRHISNLINMSCKVARIGMMYSLHQSLGLLASPSESYTTKQFTVSPIIMYMFQMMTGVAE